MPSDREMRQLVGYAIARAENVAEEGLAVAAHLRSVHDALTERIETPAPEPPVEPPTEPEPPVVEPPEPPVVDPPVEEPTPSQPSTTGWMQDLPGGGSRHDWDAYLSIGSLLQNLDQDLSGDGSDILAERAWARGVALNESTASPYFLFTDGPGEPFGARALRLLYPGAPYGAGGDDQIAVDMALPSSARTRDATVRLRLRWSSTWATVSDHKTMFWFDGAGRRWELRFGAFTNRLVVKVDNSLVAVAKNPDGSELDLRATKLVWDYEWHDVIWSFTNGRIRVWVDGTKWIDVANPGGTTPMETLALGRNGDPQQPATLDVGEVRVYPTMLAGLV